MIKVYGIIKKSGFAIGDDTQKILLGEYTRQQALQILGDPLYIKQWNKSHIVELIKIIFEMEV